MKTILVGVDGSDEARAATAWAAQLALQLDAAVVAVHAVGMLEHDRADPENLGLQARMDGWTEALDELPAGRVQRHLVPGEPVACLLRSLVAEHADLVVVGTHGIGARTGVILGSTSLKLAEQSPCALVVIPRAMA